MSTPIQAQLCDLTIKGFWTGSRRDEQVERRVDEENHSEGCGTYRKRLFPEKTCGAGNPHVEWNRSCFRVREVWRRMTAPWEDGRRVLSARYTQPFADAIGPMIEQANERMEQFAQWLPQGIELAAQGLNGLFRPGDYPSGDQVRSGWSIRWMLLPIPQSSHLISDIVGPAIEQARQKLEEYNASQIEQSKRLVWLEVLDPVLKMADTLAKPGAKFWDTLVQNVRDMAERIPLLNFTDDPALGQAKERLLALTRDVDVEQLRHDPLVRRAKSEEAAALAAQFVGYGRRFE